VVWNAPVTKAGIVEQGQPCAAHKPEDNAGQYERSEADQDKISQCGFELVNILYLSPEIMSIGTYSGQSEDCEPRGGHSIQDYRARRFDSDGALDFGELLGPKARNGYTRALPKRVHSMDGEDCEITFEDAETGWRIAHELERWRPHLHQELGYLCSVDAPVSFPLPASLTGDKSPILEWKILQSRVNGIAFGLNVLRTSRRCAGQAVAHAADSPNRDDTVGDGNARPGLDRADRKACEAAFAGTCGSSEACLQLRLVEANCSPSIAL
jgi:hypothetical protein